MKCKQRVIIQQNSECIVQGILPKTINTGLLCVCTSSKFMSKPGLLLFDLLSLLYDVLYIILIVF